MSATITWVAVETELPDADQTVLMHLEDGEVWTGFLEERVWRYLSGERISMGVLHWAEFPAPPEV